MPSSFPPLSLLTSFFPTSASQDDGRGLYLQFANMLINDSIYLLDESLKQLPTMQEIHTQMSDEVAWEARPQQERQEREQQLRSSGPLPRFWFACGFLPFPNEAI